MTTAEDISGGTWKPSKGMLGTGRTNVYWEYIVSANSLPKSSLRLRCGTVSLPEGDT